MGSWYLVRHGETEWNRKGKIQGHLDVPLNEHGRRQVKCLRKDLLNVGSQRSMPATFRAQ